MVKGPRRGRAKDKEEVLMIEMLAKTISSDSHLSGLAAAATKREVDRIYGYSKYEPDEISGEIRERLYNLGYLGASVAAIIEDQGVPEETKTALAEGYLQALVDYEAGKVHKVTGDYWSDAEPMYTAEPAAYLADRGRFHWNDQRLLRAVLAFAEYSTTAARRLFLSNVVHQANLSEEFCARLSTPTAGEFYSELFRTLSTSRLEELGIGGDWKSKITMLENIGPLLCADSACAAAGLLCELSCLTDDDLVQLFASNLFVFILIRIDNHISFYSDLAQGLIERRKKGGISEGDTLGLLFRALKKAYSSKTIGHYKRVHADDSKLEALIRLGSKMETSMVPPTLAETAMGFAEYSMQTSTRFDLLKFAYEKSSSDEQRKNILDRAGINKSSRIREWILSMRSEPEGG